MRVQQHRAVQVSNNQGHYCLKKGARLPSPLFVLFWLCVHWCTALPFSSPSLPPPLSHTLPPSSPPPSLDQIIPLPRSYSTSSLSRMVDDPISHSKPEFVSKRQDLVSEAPLYDLVQRRLPPAYHTAFVFVLKPDMDPVNDSKTNIYDPYKVSNDPTSDDPSNSNSTSRILIQAASLSGLGAGLNHYLRQVCQVELSWAGDRLNTLPSTIPKLADGQVLTGSSFVPWRYYMNVVTYGYSYAFWDWSRWEKELDWMMLNGVNMGLAMVGQEHVHRQFYLNLGLTEDEISDFLSGPAFTPWQRMGNLQGSWGYSNMTVESHFKTRWYETQWALQQKIIERMRDFNMTAVLPSFNGFVPRAMINKHPNATYEKSSNWAGMPEQYTRDVHIPSTDPMFTTLSEKFINLQTSMYNGYTSHHYLLDLYNELDPPCEDLPCLTKVSTNVMRALKSADPQAVWVMQGWFLVNRATWSPERTKAFFDGIKQYNDGKDAFVFDLYSDVSPLWKDTEGFYGIEWGWSMLNNFGGGQGLYGTLPTLLTEPFAGYNHPAKSMRGMGITMEGINNNEFLYHLILDLAWQRADEQVTTPIDGAKLLREFIQRRYGPNQTTPEMLQAWEKLSQTVWDCRTGQMSQSKTYIDKSPSLIMDYDGFMPTKMWYNKTTVVEAWELLIKSTETEASNRRRHGPIQYIVEDVLLAVLSHSQSQSEPGPITFSSRIRQSIREVLRAISTRSASTRLVITDEEFEQALHSQSPPTTTGTTNSSVPFNSNNNSNNTLPQDQNQQQSTDTRLPLEVSSFRYDLIDVTREVLLGIVMPALHKELVHAYQDKNANRVRYLGDALLGVIDDTDRLLSTHSHFMLGTWLAEARARASDTGLKSSSSSKSREWPLSPRIQHAYEDYLEFNARNQITWWGPYGQQPLADYASKHWGGLVRTFYRPRWKTFIDHLRRALARGGKPYDQAAFRNESLAQETEWQKQTIAPMNVTGRDVALSTGMAQVGTEEKGDTIQIAQDIWDRWGVLAQRVASGERV